MHPFFSIFILNLLTSMDNAIVLSGIAKQHKNLLAIGFLSSVVITVCRTALIMGVASVSNLPGLRLTLGIIVLFVALNLANVKTNVERDGVSFWHVLLMVVVTDLALSVDNILSLAVLSKNLFVVASSVFLSLLPLLMLLPTIVRTMERVVWLRVFAAGFVAELAIDSITDDPWVVDRIPRGHFELILRIASAIVIILYGFWRMNINHKHYRESDV